MPSSNHINFAEAMYIRTGVLDERGEPTADRGRLADDAVVARLREHLGYGASPACLPCRDLARRLVRSRGQSLTSSQKKSASAARWGSAAAAVIFLPLVYFYSGHIFAQEGVHAWDGFVPVSAGDVVTAGDSARTIVLMSGFFRQTGQLELAPGSAVQWNSVDDDSQEWELLEGGMEVRLEAEEEDEMMEGLVVRAGEVTAEPAAELDGDFVLQISIEPLNTQENEVTDNSAETAPAVVNMTVIAGEAVYSEPENGTASLLDSGESAHIETETETTSP